MALVRSFWLSKKKGKQAWVEPIVNAARKTVAFEIRTGNGEPQEAPKVGRGAKFRCLVCRQTAEDQHIKDEGKAGRISTQMIAIVAEGDRERVYLSPLSEHIKIASEVEATWRPEIRISGSSQYLGVKPYGMLQFGNLFTERQLIALTLFSDLVAEARELALD